MSSAYSGPRVLGSFKGFGLLIDYLRDRGHDVEAVLSAAGVSLEVLQTDDLRVEREELEELWGHAIAATGDPALPLRVASTVRPNSLGVFGYLANASESGRDGFERTSRIVGLMAEAVEVRLALSPAEAVIYLHYRDAHRPRRETSEYAVGIMVFMSRLVGTQKGDATAAHFAHRAPPHASEYERILGLPVVFGAEHNGIVTPRAAFDAPNPTADAVLRTLIEQHAERLLHELPHGERLSDRVRSAILLRLAHGTPSIDEIAAVLRSSPRSLRRHLEHENTTYREILDDLRRNIALRALEDEGKTIDEAAQLTGFSDASAFHKAFRRWTGRSPARS